MLILIMMLQGVANRDLKLENLLLDRPWGEGMRPLLKICDFGYSKSEMSSPARTSVGKRWGGSLVTCWLCVKGFCVCFSLSIWLLGLLLEGFLVWSDPLSLAGTPIYVAPEILMAQDSYNPKVCTAACVIFKVFDRRSCKFTGNAL
jgi:serine/threonine protein kinase